MKRCNRIVEIGRRQFLRGGVTAAAAAVAAGSASRRRRDASGRTRELFKPADRQCVELKVDQPVQISYPDKDSPGVLLKLGHRVEGGVGPDGDIVAFSTLCPHKGFPLVYVAADKTLNCPGHYCRFDPKRAAWRSSATPRKTCRSSAWSWTARATSTPSPSTS